MPLPLDSFNNHGIYSSHYGIFFILYWNRFSFICS